MPDPIPVYIGKEAVERLADYVHQNVHRPIVLASDENTYQAAGHAIEEALKRRGSSLQQIILAGDTPLKADEKVIVQLLLFLDQDCLLIAVGSGTVTDIVRFASHRARLPFISFPTAASVDAYTSFSSALLLKNVKRSIPAQTPQAVFADLGVLCAAPPRMTAAGFGDMLAKYTGLADWKLANLLVDEPYDSQVGQRAEVSLQSCVAHVQGIGSRTPEGIDQLANALMISGECMSWLRSSRPAAGSEHSLAHFWEMKHILEDKPGTLHGAKTGVATVLTSRLYDEIRRLSRQEAQGRLHTSPIPLAVEEIGCLKEAYGPVAEEIIAGQASFLGMSEADFARLKQRISERWDDIQEIASRVPSSSEVTRLLREAGAPASPEEIGISTAEVEQALGYAIYLRNRFSVLELSHLLGLLT